MDIFRLRDEIIRDYARYTKSFTVMADDRIRQEVEKRFDAGLLWPEPLIQLNPSFAPGGTVDWLVERKILHPLCREIFRMGKSDASRGSPMQLYRHQTDAIQAARRGEHYVLTTGTGSGKSLAYIVPIVDYVLRYRKESERGIKAIVVYPMNALANSQEQELDKFLEGGSGMFPVTFRRYTGQEKMKDRREIVDNPPDILLTNYMMLELILTRPYEERLRNDARHLQFLVFDELHTYRGRQGADVAMLIRRLRETLRTAGGNADFRCIGTSATLAGEGTYAQKQREVAAVASRIFGCKILPDNVIGETLTAETVGYDPDSATYRDGLAAFLRSGEPMPCEYEQFCSNPLASWIENTIGVRKCGDRLERCNPRPLGGENGLAGELSGLAGVDEELCRKRLQEALLAGAEIRRPETGNRSLPSSCISLSARAIRCMRPSNPRIGAR